MPPFRRASSCSLLAIVVLIALAGGPVQARSAASRPAHFDSNAAVDLGDGLTCVVGNATDADGMNARAWVTVEDKATHKVRWATPVPLAKGWYQNQATHCLKTASRFRRSSSPTPHPRPPPPRPLSMWRPLMERPVV